MPAALIVQRNIMLQRTNQLDRRAHAAGLTLWGACCARSALPHGFIAPARYIKRLLSKPRRSSVTEETMSEGLNWPEELAALAGERAMQPFLLADAAVFVLSDDGARLLHASPAGAALLSPGFTSAAAARLALLAGGLAPLGGLRLERLEFAAADGPLPLTCACRLIRLRSGGTALMVGVLPPPGGLPAPAAAPPAGREAAPEEAEALFPEPVAPDVPAAMSAAPASIAVPADEPVPAPAAPLPARLRILWETDAAGRLTRLSPNLALAFGSEAEGQMLGRSWGDLIGQRLADPEGALAAALAGGSTWTAVPTLWRIGGSREAYRVAMSGAASGPALREGRPGGLLASGFAMVATARREPWPAPEAEEEEAAPVDAAPADATPEDSGSVETLPSDAAASALSAPAGRAPAQDELDLWRREAEADQPPPRIPVRAEPAAPAAPGNVVRLPLQEGLAPAAPNALSRNERNAFREIARALSARLEGEHAARVAALGPAEPTGEAAGKDHPPEAPAEPPHADRAPPEAADMEPRADASSEIEPVDAAPDHEDAGSAAIEAADADAGAPSETSPPPAAFEASHEPANDDVADELTTETQAPAESVVAAVEEETVQKPAPAALDDALPPETAALADAEHDSHASDENVQDAGSLDTAGDGGADAPEAEAEDEEADVGTVAGDSAPQPLHPVHAAPSASIIPLQVAARAMQEAGFQDMVDRLPIGVLVMQEERVVFANRTLLDLLDYASVAELAEAGVDRIFAVGHPERAAGVVTLRQRDGGHEPVDARLSSMTWRGEPATLISFRRAVETADQARIDALKLDVAKAQGEKRELSAILDTATDGVATLDERGRILSLNRSAEALFGYDQREVVGDNFTLLLAPESHLTALDYLQGLKGDGVASLLNDGREVIGRVRQGGRIPLFMTMGRVSDGEERRYSIVLRDMTSWKQAEAELVEARKAAERASAQKSDVLAKISHEIRTPLNAIIGFTEVMSEERFGPIGNERYKEYLTDIHQSGAYLISLVNDLLDLAKIEAGKMDLNFTSVSLNEVATTGVALLQPEAARQRVVLRTGLQPKLPPVVADERSIRQIVINVLSNAVKFTDAGGQVIISTALGDRGEVILRVRDTGIGMTEKELAQAMEPFRQVAATRRGSGTGLGLPITRALVEANKGALAITSVKNEGTLVEITFPPQRVLAS